MSREDARWIVANFVTRYNAVRLHRALGYGTPKDKLEGRAEAILAARERKLPAARERRARMRRGTFGKRLTGGNEENKVPVVGETEAGKAGERPARDSRPGRRTTVAGESSDSPVLILPEGKEDVPSPFLPHKTPGSGAEPQDLVTAKAPGGPESLIGERHLSISR